MGEGLTDYQAKQIIAALRGIDKRLKELNETLEKHFEKTERTQPEPPADPFGYTE